MPRPVAIFLSSLVALAGWLVAPPALQAQTEPKVFFACYDPLAGLVYRINEPGLRTACFKTTHVQFSWTDGPPGWDHGLLKNLLADHHTQYLLADGGRPLTGNLSAGGFKITGLAAALANGEAVRFEQAVKSGDGAAGDLTGAYPNPGVAKLQGSPVSATAPSAAGQVLTWDGSAWSPTVPPAGVTDHGALNGLTDDDHPQYLFASGLRPLGGNLSAGGFKLTGLGAATAAGDAVRFEQAVKRGDAAGGDLSGAYPNPGVAKLQGSAVSASGPTTAGQVLTWDGSAWAPAALASGVTEHGMLTGLADDDHPQYLLTDGVRSTTNGFAVTGTAGAGTIPATGAGTRLMWYPGKAAFRAGRALSTEWDDANVGVLSTAMGQLTTASGSASTAMGLATTASGDHSTAMGQVTLASGFQSTAMGFGATASGSASTAMGVSTTASGDRSTAMGSFTRAHGDNSTAMGVSTTASGPASTAMGVGTTASGDRSTAMGVNTMASGDLSTAMGRSTTASGLESTAMGSRALANFRGSFVYGDASTDILVTAGAGNRFVVRASGGTIFYSNPDLTAGVSLAPGAGAWASVSDVNRKEHFRDVGGEEVLAKIARMPIREWSYKAQRPSIRHLGPTAQDFHAAFGLGESDTTITTTDIDGVNLLAVQALEHRTRDLGALRERLATLEHQNERLRAELAALREEFARQRRQP